MMIGDLIAVAVRLGNLADAVHETISSEENRTKIKDALEKVRTALGE